MQKIGLIAVYEMRQLLYKRWLIVYYFIMPLMLIFILGSALSDYFDSGESFKDPVIIAAAIGDDGPVGERLHMFLKEEQNRGMIAVLPAESREDIDKRLAEGKADAGIVLPAGTSNTAFKGAPVSADLVLRGSSGKSFVGQMILSRFIDDLNDKLAAAKVLGTDVVEAVKSAPIHSLHQDFVRMVKLSPADKQFTALQYYGATMLVMFMLYSGMMAAISLAAAKENHTLYRLYSMPIRPFDVLAGKLAGLIGVAFLQALLLIAGTRLLYGLDWGGRTGLLALVCLLVIICSMSLAVIIGLFVKTSKGVHAVFQPLIIVMTFLSGGFSPSVGSVLSVFGQFTVNHWAVQGILHMMLDGDRTFIIRQISFLGLIAAVLVLAAAQTVRKVGYR